MGVFEHDINRQLVQMNKTLEKILSTLERILIMGFDQAPVAILLDLDNATTKPQPIPHRRGP